MGRAPIRHTCPDINKYIKDVLSAADEVSCLETEDNKRDVSRAVDMVRDLEYHFEEIRTSNGALRDWGYEENERAEKLEVEVGELTDKIDDLESEIKSRDQYIKELEDKIKTYEDGLVPS